MRQLCNSYRRYRYRSIAPAFGEDDANVGRKYDLPFVQLVDGNAEMTKETPWAGTFCKDVDKEILVNLEERGQLFNAPKFEHSYPFVGDVIHRLSTMHVILGLSR